MPEAGRVLQFPARSSRRDVSVAEVRSRAESLLNLAASGQYQDLPSDLDVLVDALLTACSILKDKINATPAAVRPIASGLYMHVFESCPDLGLFDERHFLLGELAWLAGNGCRLSGSRDEAERWFDRADANFRHTVNPAPLLTRVSFSRLSLRYDMRRFDEVLELLPSVSLSFEKLGMRLELAKTRFLEALTQKETGNQLAAISALEALTNNGELESEPGFLGMAFVNLGDLLAQDSAFDKALASYGRALSLLRNANHGYAIAHLKTSVADTLHRQGKVLAAVEAFREAVQEYLGLEMVTWAAHVRVLLAETLLEAGRAREAEWELLAALPTIEEQKMVPQGFAAIALLQESVRQRKTDPKALSELREYLQAKN